jgi:hypothetical protein
MEPTQFIIMLLCVIIVMGGATWSFMMYTIINQQQTASQASNLVIKQINDKLDFLHTQSNTLVNAQGNISSAQRQTLINALYALPGSINTTKSNHAMLVHLNETLEKLVDNNSIQR